jgi:4-amino-4-deoxy-L-arabinose transferase-like glycosyltransferase
MLLTVGFRIVRLTADPPSDFSWSGGYFADEGFWSHNARNAVLYGQAVRDEWNAAIVSPIFASIQFWIFHLFGPGFAQVRLIGIFSAISIALASFVLFNRQYRQEQAFFFALSIVLNFPMLVLARQGILDPFAAALSWLAFVLLMSDSWPAVFFAGVLAVGSCLTKYLMVYTFVPLLLALIFSKQRKLWLAFAIGSLITAALWFTFIYIPNQELLQAYSRYYSSQQSWEFAAVIRNIALQPFYLYFIKTPAVLFYGNLAMWYFLSRPREGDTVERITWIWLLSGIVFFALWRYRPFRYYTSLALPLGALSMIAILRIDQIAAAFRRAPVLWLGMSLPVLQFVILLFDRIAHRGWVPIQLGIHLSDILVFLTLNLAVIIVLLASKQRLKWSVVLFFFAFLASDIRNYLIWMIEPKYTASEISSDLQNRVGNGVLTGQWAPELCLQNHVRVVPVWHGFVNSENPFAKYGITHVLVWKYPLGGEKFEQWYPKEFQQFQPVTMYKIKDSDLILYEKRE